MSTQPLSDWEAPACFVQEQLNSVRPQDSDNDKSELSLGECKELHSGWGREGAGSLSPDLADALCGGQEQEPCDAPPLGSMLYL